MSRSILLCPVLYMDTMANFVIIMAIIIKLIIIEYATIATT